MSMLHKSFTPDEIETLRYHPPGRYVGYITEWEKGVAQTGTEFVEFTLKANEGISGQDLQGVEMNRKLKSRRFYLSDKAMKQYWTLVAGVLGADWIQKVIAANPDADGTLKASVAAELMVGSEVEFDYLPEKNERTGKEYLNVQRFKAA
jgi:hypothetical protein